MEKSFTDLYEDAEQTLDLTEDTRLLINVSGSIYSTSTSFLLKHPHTKLGHIASSSQVRSTPIFYDADPHIFREILRFYRTGELHVPKDVCYQSFLKELKFWKINDNCISLCCLQLSSDSEDMIEKELTEFGTTFSHRDIVSMDQKPGCLTDVWTFLTYPIGMRTRPLRMASWLFIFVYFVCVMCVYAFINNTLRPAGEYHIPENLTWQEHMCNLTRSRSDSNQTIAERQRALGGFYTWVTSVMFFFFETMLRLISCPSKFRFFTSPHAVDLVLSAVEVVGLILSFTVSQNILHISIQSCAAYSVYIYATAVAGLIRCIRIMALSSVIGEMKVLMITLKRSYRELIMLLAIVFFSSLIFAPFVYLSNLGPEENHIEYVTTAQWLTVVTMTTVGYGDVYPQTLAGRGVVAIVMMSGITLSALPVAVIGGNFALIYSVHHKMKQKAEMEQSQRQIH